MLTGASLSELAGMGALFVSGQLLASDQVVFRRTARVRLQADPPLEFNLDGELFPELEELTVKPGALRVLVGRNYRRAPNTRQW